MHTTDLQINYGGRADFGLWTKPKVGGIVFLTVIAVIALVTAVALVILKCERVSLGFLHVNALSDKCIIGAGVGLLGLSLLSSGIARTIIHRTRKAIQDARHISSFINYDEIDY